MGTYQIKATVLSRGLWFHSPLHITLCPSLLTVSPSTLGRAEAQGIKGKGQAS